MTTLFSILWLWGEKQIIISNLSSFQCGCVRDLLLHICLSDCQAPVKLWSFSYLSISPKPSRHLCLPFLKYFTHPVSHLSIPSARPPPTPFLLPLIHLLVLLHPSLHLYLLPCLQRFRTLPTIILSLPFHFPLFIPLHDPSPLPFHPSFHPFIRFSCHSLSQFLRGHIYPTAI